MSTTLKTLWKNRKQIIEGIKNSIIKDDFVEEVAALRYAICDECPSKGNKKIGPYCKECGCSLGIKTRALSAECPLGKWKALITEEEEDELNELNT